MNIQKTLSYCRGWIKGFDYANSLDPMDSEYIKEQSFKGWLFSGFMELASITAFVVFLGGMMYVFLPGFDFEQNFEFLFLSAILFRLSIL